MLNGDKYTKYLLATDADTSAKLISVKNTLPCVIAALNPTPSSMETRRLGFAVACQLVLCGGDKVPARPQAFLLFPVLRLLFHFVFV